MKRIYTFVVFLMSCVASYCQNECATEIMSKNGVAYYKNDSIPYTGSYFEYYPGIVKVEGEYVRGLKQGKFVYHSESGAVDSVVWFGKGKREGITTTYYPLHGAILKSVENYKNDAKEDTSYYWDESGQLKQISVYFQGKTVTTKSFPVDSSVLGYLIGIIGEEDGLIWRCNYSDANRISAIVLRIESCKNDSSGGENATRLVPADDQRIVSFRWSGVVPFEENMEGGIDADHLNVGAEFDEQLVSWTLYRPTKRFYLGDVIVEDKNGVRRVIPWRKFEIKRCTEE